MIHPIPYFCSVVLASSCLAGAALDGQSRLQPFSVDASLFRVASESDTWSVDGLGSHRAVVDVPDFADVAHVHLEWRRPDLRLETKKILVLTENGAEVARVRSKNMTAESADIYFEPTAGAGRYYVYYLPHRFRRGSDDARYGDPWNDYTAPGEPRAWADWESLESVEAKLVAFESRRDFDFFTSMGLIASADEAAKIKADNPQNPIIFPEDRAYPIKLQALPAKWGQEGGPATSLSGQAARNEYYTWQLGIWAAREQVEELWLEFSDLKSPSGAVIAGKGCTCFNQEGINHDGTELKFDITVPQGKVQALWCGVQIPQDTVAGLYSGQVRVTGKGMEPQLIPIEIEVSNELLADQGDGEIWRHSRLRWLNSQIGVDDEPVTPYSAMSVEGRTIQASEKKLSIAPNGMLEQVEINGKPLLAEPMSFSVWAGGKRIDFSADNVQIKQNASGRVSWSSSSTNEGITMSCEAVVEYDGHIDYLISLSSDTACELDSVGLQSQYSSYASRYFMGVGHSGGAMPEEWTWKWDGPSDSYWAGNELVGAHLEFRGGTYHGPLIADYKPEPTPLWSNGGKGSVLVKKTEDGALVAALTGAMKLSPEPVVFEFALDLTPVKPLDTKAHFAQRYFHSMPERFDRAAEADGANISNIHHAKDLNPFINYPFVVRDELIEYINHHHEQGRKVKLYYTIRELTNHTGEIHALMSLGNEILQAGPGYGTPWHTEHLIDGYKAAWYVSLKNDEADAALVLSPHSRWINYYLEGLRWMFENYKIDGIYMDDVSFDRQVMKRMRKIMAEYRPEALVDLHSNTNYSKGAMNQYTDFFPYVDRLWFGEHFNYAALDPDEWFVTFSGIPMGVMSEMLNGGGNRFLGMVYGTTARNGYSKFNPGPVWALQDEFGISDARMVGYWSEQPVVTCSNSQVKATAYVKEGAVLISLGNFADSEQTTTISLDWAALGLDASKVQITLPAVKDFQDSGSVQEGQSITIPAKEGLLLWVK